MNECSTILHHDAVLIMERWGAWAKSGNILNSLTYPSIQPVFSMGFTEKTTIADELPLCVDRCLAEIISKNKALGVITALYYLTGMSYQKLSLFLADHGYKFNRHNISGMVDSGTNSVYSAICIYNQHELKNSIY